MKNFSCRNYRHGQSAKVRAGVRVCFVALLQMLVLLGYSHAQAATDSGPYFPVLSGIIWTYRLNGSSNFTTTVQAGTVAINGVATKAFLDDDGFTNYFTTDVNGIRLHGQNDPSSGINVAFVPPIKLVNAMTNVGQTVNSSGTAVTNVGNFAYSASDTIVGFEKVAVPLGSFDAVRVSGNLSIVGSPVTQLFFLVKDLGLVKSTDSAAGDSDTQELVSRAINVACPGTSLQAAIDIGMLGETIHASGTCSENIVIRNEKQRIAIDGGGTATLNGPNANSPTLNVRGKGIVIQNLTISGGSQGIHVNRGSNAVINSNVIENTNGNGVLIDELAFSVIINNTIPNNPGAGIFVTDQSTARIGFNLDMESTANANTIQNNALGVVVSNESSARVIGNVIENNSGDGVFISIDSHADIASNAIDGNGGDGIELEGNSSVQLGEVAGSSIYQSPNTTASANTGFGVRCVDGGAAHGSSGTLSGSSGPMNFDGSCFSALAP